MKFVLIVIVVAVLIAMVRGSLRRRRSGDAPRSPPAGEPKVILSCSQCGLHLPRDEALPGRGGVFCSPAHRTAYEQAHPNE